MFSWVEEFLGFQIPAWVFAITLLDVISDNMQLMRERQLGGLIPTIFHLMVRIFGISVPCAVISHMAGDVRITPLLFHTIRTLYSVCRKYLRTESLAPIVSPTPVRRSTRLNPSPPPK